MGQHDETRAEYERLEALKKEDDAYEEELLERRRQDLRRIPHAMRELVAPAMR